MKTLIISDIHSDMWFPYAVKPYRLKNDEPKESVIFDTLEWQWKFHSIPDTEAIIIAGDMSNDYLTLSRQIKWLASKYLRVYLTLGNHDLVIKGATPSKSNAQFKTSEEKIEKIREYCSSFDNVHLLEGNIVNGIAGCMASCDLKVEPGYYDIKRKWKNNWFDGNYWNYFNQDPEQIWNHYDKMLTDLVKQKPKIVVTHFAPYEVGINWKYRNSNTNTFFYFNAEKYLEELDNGTIWLCGHIHDKKICTYKNSKGNIIKILCNPYGYPGEYDRYADTWDYTGEQLERKSRETTNNDYIIDL